jgi:hypothetical protein
MKTVFRCETFKNLLTIIECLSIACVIEGYVVSGLIALLPTLAGFFGIGLSCVKSTDWIIDHITQRLKEHPHEALPPISIGWEGPI